MEGERIMTSELDMARGLNEGMQDIVNKMVFRIQEKDLQRVVLETRKLRRLELKAGEAGNREQQRKVRVNALTVFFLKVGAMHVFAEETTAAACDRCKIFAIPASTRR